METIHIRVWIFKKVKLKKPNINLLRKFESQYRFGLEKNRIFSTTKILEINKRFEKGDF